MKRTLKRELKVLEIAEREAVGLSTPRAAAAVPSPARFVCARQSASGCAAGGRPQGGTALARL